jgi:hypothetical protein
MDVLNLIGLILNRFLQRKHLAPHTASTPRPHHGDDLDA